MKLNIRNERDVSFSMSQAKSYSTKLGFSAIKSIEISTIVSELAYNIIKYTSGGFIELHENSKGIQIIAQDSGNGIKNIEKALHEGYSSSGTLGLGIPGIIRLSNEFDVQTSSKGTTITIQKNIK